MLHKENRRQEVREMRKDERKLPSTLDKLFLSARDSVSTSSEVASVPSCVRNAVLKPTTSSPPSDEDTDEEIYSIYSASTDMEERCIDSESIMDGRYIDIERKEFYSPSSTLPFTPEIHHRKPVRETRGSIHIPNNSIYYSLTMIPSTPPPFNHPFASLPSYLSIDLPLLQCPSW